MIHNEITTQVLRWAEHVDEMCGKWERVMIIMEDET